MSVTLCSNRAAIESASFTSLIKFACRRTSSGREDTVCAVPLSRRFGVIKGKCTTKRQELTIEFCEFVVKLSCFDHVMCVKEIERV